MLRRGYSRITQTNVSICSEDVLSRLPIATPTDLNAAMYVPPVYALEPDAIASSVRMNGTRDVSVAY